MKVGVQFTSHARQRLNERVRPVFGDGAEGFVKRVARRGLTMGTAERSGARWISSHVTEGREWRVIWERVHSRLICIRTVYWRDPRDERSDLREPLVSVPASVARKIENVLHRVGSYELARALRECEGFVPSCDVEGCPHPKVEGSPYCERSWGEHEAMFASPTDKPYGW